MRDERPLSEVARHLVIPEGIVDSVWFDLEERFDEWGVEFDAWQDGLGQLILGLREDGLYATTVGGSTLSIPRQVAKTFIIGRMTMGLCSLHEDMTWLWTAHRGRTSTQTFEKLAGFAARKPVKPYLREDRSDGLRASHGEQEIRFRNGSRILFGARENGFGRGFDEVDGVVFDEGQILTERALDDMVPATNQSRSPHGALLIYMGTPPRPNIDPGEVFKGRRRKALDGGHEEFVPVERGNALYVETSADPDTGKPGGPSLDDQVQIAKANPSYPRRTPQSSIDRMRANLGSDESWLREGLGVWDDDKAGSHAIAPHEWQATGVGTPPEDGVRSFAVAFSFDGSRLALAGALKHDESVHVELLDAAEGDIASGLAGLADWLAERWRSVATIVLCGEAGAPVLAQLLKERHVPGPVVKVASTAEYTRSCSMTLDAVRESAALAKRGEFASMPFTHLLAEGQGQLDNSVAVCDKKQRGTSGAWGWTATTPDGDETPSEAMSLAYWAAKTTRRKPRGDRERKAVIL